MRAHEACTPPVCAHAAWAAVLPSSWPKLPLRIHQGPRPQLPVIQGASSACPPWRASPPTQPPCPSAVCSKGGQQQQPKGASTVKVRHILCEKHGKVLEALEKIKAGAKFDQVGCSFDQAV